MTRLDPDGEKFIKGVKYKKLDLKKFKNLKKIKKNYDYIVNSSGYINGEYVSTGTYFYQIQAGDYTKIRKMVILK